MRLEVFVAMGNMRLVFGPEGEPAKIGEVRPIRSVPKEESKPVLMGMVIDLGVKVGGCTRVLCCTHRM